MNDTVLAVVERAFKNASPPPKIAIDDLGESALIERDFAQLDPEQMTYVEAANMIIDAALVTDEAIAYFLPRLARAAIEETANVELLRRRLMALDLRVLNEAQKHAVERLLSALVEAEAAHDSEEAAEVAAGRAAWRHRTAQRGSVGDRLLLAAEVGDIEGVKSALELGADPNYRDELGNTANELARMRGHVHVVALLSSLT